MFVLEADDALSSIAAGIDELAGEELRHVDGADLIRTWKERCRLDAEFTRRFAIFEKRYGFTADGALSGAAWLRAHCHMDAGAASDRVFTARKLLSLPETEAAFGAGEINYEHARVIARAVDSCGPEAVLEHEKVLVDVGREEVPQKLRYATEVLQNAVDPDGALHDANAQHARRGLWISELDGVYRLVRNPDPHGGPTEVDNVYLFCRPHHRLVHEGGWRVSKQPGGELLALPP